MLLAAAGSAWADPPPGRDTPRPQASARQDANDALSDAVRRIQRTTQGQVLSAERVPFDGRSVNRIKVVDDRGRVRIYMDDPQAQPTPTRDDDD
ncbi:MAG: hypothetical protein LC715_05495 [Gammaproteobacteria bacterium]|nr:hypothetical protein [Gammaproteobacteria bacterium]